MKFNELVRLLEENGFGIEGKGFNQILWEARMGKIDPR